jgi:hypothetical protein
MLYFNLLVCFLNNLIAAANAGELTEHLARHLNPNTQYGLDEPFVGKEYRAALIIGHRWLNYNIQIDKLIRFALLQRHNLSRCQKNRLLI